MSKFTSIEELFNTAEQSVGPPTEGGDGNQELRVFQPDRGIDLTYNNPNFTGQSDTSTSTQILEERDNRQTLGTVTLNNRDYWENSNFDESIFQSYEKLHRPFHIQYLELFYFLDSSSNLMPSVVLILFPPNSL